MPSRLPDRLREAGFGAAGLGFLVGSSLLLAAYFIVRAPCPQGACPPTTGELFLLIGALATALVGIVTILAAASTRDAHRALGRRPPAPKS